MLTIGRSICRDIDAGLTKEWLVTNGRGGYASSTIPGANTRRYHGLLVASLDPPHGHTVLLSKMDEELQVSGRNYYLGTNEYQGNTIHPTGFLHLEECRIEGTIPTFVFDTREATIAKTVWMEHGQNTTYIRYQIERTDGPVTLVLTPLCNHRSFHSLTQGSPDGGFETHTLPNNDGCEVVAFAGAAPYLLLANHGARFAPTGVWYWHYIYRQEKDRGYQHTEDLYSPGLFRVMLDEGEILTVIASAEPVELIDRDGEKALYREQKRQAGVRGNHEDEFLSQLYLAADQFVVTPRDSGLRSTIVSASSAATGQRQSDGAAPEVRGIHSRYTVVAGYHWFSDWGRDTLISLPGLTLATGRFALAKEILRTFARHCWQGLMPNLFAEGTDVPLHNAADVSLWFFVALYRYLEATQ
ncbi:MAG: amylo-alpha-1,6-glucosidase, partial [Chloroflexi bacterium]|nr:amylo-alpha-1,6-glucosidase [Chloroflexota bacterium]